MLLVGLVTTPLIKDMTSRPRGVRVPDVTGMDADYSLTAASYVDSTGVVLDNVEEVDILTSILDPFSMESGLKGGQVESHAAEAVAEDSADALPRRQRVHHPGRHLLPQGRHHAHRQLAASWQALWGALVDALLRAFNERVTYCNT